MYYNNSIIRTNTLLIGIFKLLYYVIILIHIFSYIMHAIPTNNNTYEHSHKK
jgi:hypothetical protein